MWDTIVELLRAALFTGAHVLGGSLGASVIVVTTLLRLATLPLTLRAARRARAQQAKLAAIRPQLERIKRRYANDPARAFADMRALQKKHGISILSGSALASAAVQLPLLGGLFGALRSGLGARVRFLWVADLARTDALLVVLATALAAVAASTATIGVGSPLTPRLLAGVAIAATLVFLWSASSAMALSVGAGSAVSLLQNWLLRRDGLLKATAAG